MLRTQSQRSVKIPNSLHTVHCLDQSIDFSVGGFRRIFVSLCIFIVNSARVCSLLSLSSLFRIHVMDSYVTSTSGIVYSASDGKTVTTHNGELYVMSNSSYVPYNVGPSDDNDECYH